MTDVNIALKLQKEASLLGDEYRPKTMLDFGSGPGTAVVAGRGWESIQSAVLIEPSTSMWEIAQKLLLNADTNEPSDREYEEDIEIRWQTSLPRYLKGVHPIDFPKFDLITATFSMSELPSDAARTVAISLLWEMLAPQGVLIVVENGSTRGIEIVQKLRKTVLAGISCEQFYDDVLLEEHVEEAPKSYMPQVIAPCTHSRPCPLFEGDFPQGRYREGCHFSQITDRYVTIASSRGQGRGRRLKRMDYSYIAFRKVAAADSSVSRDSALGRLVRKPILGGEHVLLDVCQGHGGIERVPITKKKHKHLYRKARKATWGGLWREENL
mmetsp:Transcript_15196/g.18429  ORF Transcript_15196/g.18429 Transcript_15196/m.18429 type:complete len:325 (+) Transcript_15196:3-977(+)